MSNNSDRNHLKPKGVIGPFIKTLTGETICLKDMCNRQTTFAEIKQMIHDIAGYPPEEQRIISAGRCCEDNETIDHNNELNSTFHLVLRRNKGDDKDVEA
mmetsp:Transcript_17693/g.29615  ORF Transcript_17693/g.29615 Transcript_17693/m.29615 type:complete len:100 (+) Transcript_17693:93-392(+)